MQLKSYIQLSFGDYNKVRTENIFEIGSGWILFSLQQTKCLVIDIYFIQISVYISILPCEE